MGLRRGWRELRANAVRYLAVLALVALGLTVVVGLTASALGTLAALDRAVSAGRLADGEFTTVSALSDQQLAGLRRAGLEIEDAATLDLARTDAPPGRAVTLRMSALPARLNLPVVVAGRAPAAPGEVLLDRLHAKAVGVRVGDAVAVAGCRLTVVGVGSLPHYAFPLADPADPVGLPAAFGAAVVHPDDLATLVAAHPGRVVPTYAYRLHGTTQARLRALLLDLPVDTASARNRVLAAGLKRAAASGLDLAYPNLDAHLPAADNPRVTSPRDDAELNARISTLAGALVMVVVGYVLATFAADRIDCESTIIGTLLATGFTPGELLRTYLGPPVAIAALGAALGTAGGYALAPLLTLAVAEYYSLPDIAVGPDVALVAGAVAVPTLIVAGVNVLVLRARLSRTPLALLRPVPDGGAEPPSQLVRTRLLPRLGFTARFRIRQALRSRGSYALIAAGIGLATWLLVFALGMDATIRAHVDRVGADVRFAHAYALRFPDLAGVPAGATPATAVPMRVLGRDGPVGEVTVLGLSPGEPYFGADVAGLGAYELVVSDAVAARFAVGPGDVLTLREAHGELNRAFTVARVVPYASGLFAFTTREHACDLLDPQLVVLAPLLSSPAAEPGETPSTGSGNPSTGSGATTGYYNMLFADTELSLDPDRVAAHTARTDALAGVASFNDLMGPTIAAILGPALALFVIVLYVLVHTAAGRQRYAIALLKALGYTEREVARLYLANYGLVVAGTVAAAVPLSTLVMGPMWRAMTAHVSLGAPFVVPPATVALIVGLAAASYLLVRVVAGHDLRRVPVTEVLKFRE